ncbi:MAG: hypothetical protein LBI44_00985 [Oscillospiraceae bacterium]|jgi:hypothetical protein|nr:hypothetical protein [Oscillospiraceae bacterium]
MSSGESEKAAFLVLITGRGQKNAILSDLADLDIRIVNTVYGKGTVKADVLHDILGLVPEENKVIIVCVSRHFKIEAVLRLLVDKYNFDKPNKGIAFTMPIEKISY